MLDKRKLFCGLMTVVMAAFTGLAIGFTLRDPEIASNTFAINNGVSPSDYTTEFVCRTNIDGDEMLLAYDVANKKLIETNDVEEATYQITFIDNETITIKKDEYDLGYNGSGTDLKNTATQWTLEDGKPVVSGRTLAFRTSTYKFAKAYSKGNVDNDGEYYQVYFYTKAEYDSAALRCQWEDSDREEQLSNFAYVVPPVPIKYTVSFNANGGDGIMEPIQVKENTSFPLPACTFTAPDGKEFDYWSINDTEAAFPIMITGNITLVANWKDKPVGEHISALTFTAKCNGSGISDDLKTWAITSDGTESNFDTTKGIHYGTNSASVQYIKLSSTAYNTGKITRVVVNASTASSVTATISVTVGGSPFGGDAQTLTSSAANYTFNGDSDAGEIIVSIMKPSSATKAIYCKSVIITYIA